MPNVVGLAVSAVFCLCAILAVALEVTNPGVNIFDNISLLSLVPGFEEIVTEFQAMAAMMFLALFAGVAALGTAYMDGEGTIKRPGTWLIIGGLISIIWPAYFLARNAGGDIALVGGSVWSGVAAAVVGLLGGCFVCYSDNQGGAPSKEVQTA